MRGKNATLVVLGDIGRSPRMCYHAKSLADRNYQVQVVGYTHTVPHPSISEHPNIRFVSLRCPPTCISSLRPPLALVCKFFWTLATLLFALFFRVNWPLLILLQNPPGVPSMFACWLTARIRQAQFVIDWHNYTYSVLRENHGLGELRVERVVDCRQRNTAPSIEENALSANAVISGGDIRKRMTKTERAVQQAAAEANKKKRSSEKKRKISLLQRFVESTYYWEGYFGKRADLNLCVTHAMRQDMREAWGFSSATLYDRPPSWKFKRLDDEERHSLFLRFARLGGDFKPFACDDSKCALYDEDVTEVTRFSYRDSEGVAHLRDDRPLLLLSSTSWTEDEDFGLLLDALREFDSIARLSSKSNPQTRLPRLVCIITGRGPLKEHYLGRIEHMQIEQIEIITPWLEAVDYPKVLGSADIGVSLHTSTSGLDLPMKVVDMFGSGLPVIAKRFACIGELVVEGHNGRLFDTSHELSQIIKSLSCGFPSHSAQLKALASNLKSDPLISWDKNWDACVWPLICTYGAPPSDELARRQRYAVTEINTEQNFLRTRTELRESSAENSHLEEEAFELTNNDDIVEEKEENIGNKLAATDDECDAVLQELIANSKADQSPQIKNTEALQGIEKEQKEICESKNAFEDFNQIHELEGRNDDENIKLLSST